ncbi:MAG: L-serine ammonia-lyase [Bacteroidota bacterium]
MERLSIFDIYKIGVGPSSSHTLGPWNAALQFINALWGLQLQPDEVVVHLYGSLSKTGVGHATDLAVQLGLEGCDPVTIDTAEIPIRIERIRAQEEILIHQQRIKFVPRQHIVFHSFAKPEHPNTLSFQAYREGELLLEQTYYSLGGGFIEQEGVSASTVQSVQLPFPIDKGEELLRHADQQGASISEVVWANELRFREYPQVKEQIDSIFQTMLECVYRGITTEGTLPGGLNVKRRAAKLNQDLLGQRNFASLKEWLELVGQTKRDFKNVNQWVSCFALAVNEENAALGRVVTSPTNGAAGVIPAVLLYMYFFCDHQDLDAIERFLLTSGEIGCLFKKGATISAAVGGCQAEIGVSSAMAAGGLTEILGGTPRQVLSAAEIAMEHHLGLTCDPIGGLVQVPCIERNAMGAMKAITAAHLALATNPEDCLVNFDVIVKTMWDTAQDMNHKYKETSEGGLAFNLPVVLPSC